jgi:protein-S-isoprenylcysteine O-methyltransferase Ste14
MTSLRIGIGVVWGLFWIGWLVSAFTAKRGTHRTRSFFGVRIVIIIVIVATKPLWRHAHLVIHSWPLALVGTALFLCGLGVAVWARLCMGANWGMPMTLKQEPELVQDGPYRYVRHPIYSGLILAFIGTTMATSLVVLIVVVPLSAYFVWSARTEEQILSRAMPSSYPGYMAHTKMLVPFVY